MISPRAQALTEKGVLYVWGKHRDARNATPNTVSRDLPPVHADALARASDRLDDTLPLYEAPCLRGGSALHRKGEADR